MNLKSISKNVFLGVAAAAALVALASCGGDEDSGSSAGGKTLTACEYSTKVTGAAGQFAENVGALGDAITETGNIPDAVKLIDSVDSETTKVITDLRSLKLSKDDQKVNTALIGVFEDFRKKTSDLKTAMLAKDLSKIESISDKLGEDVTAKFEQLEKDNKSQVEKYKKCEA